VRGVAARKEGGWQLSMRLLLCATVRTARVAAGALSMPSSSEQRREWEKEVQPTGYER